MISFISGMLMGFFIFTKPKETKKQLLEHITSLLINFVIYVWLGKVIIYLKQFISDPLSVLAYPADSKAFYVATVCLFINLMYRKYRHNEALTPMIQLFLPIFLSASSIYEFFNVVIDGHTGNRLYFLFMIMLTISYMIIHGNIPLRIQTILFGMILIVGQLLLSVFMASSVFSYRLSPYFFVIM